MECKFDIGEKNKPWFKEIVNTFKIQYINTFSRPEEILALLDFEFMK